MKGETLIRAYVDAVIERDSYKPREGEEQTPSRDSALKLANANLKVAYSKLTGAMLGEARRRIAASQSSASGSPTGTPGNPRTSQCPDPQ